MGGSKKTIKEKVTAEKYEKFNKLMEQYNQSDEITTYDQLYHCINKAMVKSIGKKWITTDRKPRKSQIVKENRKKKQENHSIKHSDTNRRCLRFKLLH